MATFFEDMNYALQQGGNLSNTVLAHQHKLLDEQAQIKARTQMLEYKVAENKFLQDLETDGDYQSWSRKADNFLSEQKKYINSNAGNALTAKYMNQKLDASRANLQMQVSNKMFDRIRKDEFNEYSRQMQLVEQNTSGQERIDGIDMITKEMVGKGHIDEAGRDRFMSQAYSGATLDEYTARCNEIASKAVANGWTEDQTEAAMKKALSELPAYSMKGTNGEDISQLFTPEMKSRAIQSAVNAGNDIYKNDLEVLQTKNKEYCAELLRRERSLAPDDYKGRNFLRQQGREYLREQEKLNPNSFSAAGKQEYASAFQPLKEPEKNSAEGRANGLKEFGIKADSLANMWVQHRFTGDYAGINNAEEAMDYYENQARIYARTNGLDEDQFCIDARFQLMDALEKKIKLVPEAKEAYEKVKNATKTFSNSTYDAECAWEIAAPMIMSEIFSTDIGSQEGKQSLRIKSNYICWQIQSDKILRNAQGTVIDNHIFGDKKFFSDGGSSQTYEQKQAFLTKAFEELNSTATYAYKYTRTGEEMIKPGAEGTIEKVNLDTQELLGDVLGVDGAKITHSWHKDSGHHITDQIDYMLEDGRVIHAVSRNGVLSFVDKDGKTVVSGDTIKNYYDKKIKEQKWKSEGELRAVEERKKDLKRKQKAYDELSEKRYHQHVDASAIQAHINEHEDEIKNYMKQGMTEEEAIKESIDKFNKHAADKIEYSPDWRKHNKF